MIAAIVGILLWRRRSRGYGGITRGTQEPHHDYEFHIDGPSGAGPHMTTPFTTGMVSHGGAGQSTIASCHTLRADRVQLRNRPTTRHLKRYLPNTAMRLLRGATCPVQSLWARTAAACATRTQAWSFPSPALRLAGSPRRTAPGRTTRTWAPTCRRATKAARARRVRLRPRSRPTRICRLSPSGWRRRRATPGVPHSHVVVFQFLAYLLV